MECLNFGCCIHENQLFQEQAGCNNMYLANVQVELAWRGADSDIEASKCVFSYNKTNQMH
jgi:hypothetical protein